MTGRPIIPPDTSVRVTDGVWADHTGTVSSSDDTTTRVMLTLKGGGRVLITFPNERLTHG